MGDHGGTVPVLTVPSLSMRRDPHSLVPIGASGGGTPLLLWALCASLCFCWGQESARSERRAYPAPRYYDRVYY